MRKQAIRNLYPSVVTFRGDTAYDGNEVIVTVDEATVTIEIARLVIQAEADAAAEANRLASAKEKLEGLGLTTEEVKTAFGI